MDEQVRILLIEDDARFAESTSTLLSSAGWSVRTCPDGRSGLAALDAEDFDLVLLDIGLPDMTGHEVARTLRDKGEPVPVIVVSGECHIDAAIQALRLGAVDYVRKPIEPEFLLHTIRRVLKQRWLEREYKAFQLMVSQSERMHRFLVDHSPDIIFTLDNQDCIDFINDRVQERLGISRQSLLGRPFTELVFEDDRDRVLYSLQEKRRAGSSSQSMEMRLVSTLDGRGYRRFEVQLFSLPDACPGLQAAEPGHADGPCSYGVARDTTERYEAEQWANYHSNHDALTGLPNHNLFTDRVGLAITQAQRNQERFAILSLNLDRFSAINERYGHAKADELLQQMAERIKRCLRGGDTLARFAADEFLLLNMPIRSEEDVLSVIERIRSELATPFRIDQHEVVIRASMGVAVYPEHGEDAETLIKHANIALYHGRNAGLGGHAFFAKAMRAHTDQKLQIEQELQQALQRQEFELYFQPQVEIDTRRITGVEALLRWNHPQRGLLAPGDFIAVAEETGLIIPISHWVLAEVCRLIRHWDKLGLRPPRVSVNLSPRCLDLLDFVECFTGYLDSQQIDPRRIEVEITENLFIRDPAAVTHKLNALTDRGVKIAIDDFGMQYSSLSYLQKFPIHTLKIDKSFVWEIDREFRQHTIIKAIISIGHGLGLNLIAEGVETEAQLHFLEAQGCHEIQGYLISKPLPQPTLERVLAQGLQGVSRHL